MRGTNPPSPPARPAAMSRRTHRSARLGSTLRAGLTLAALLAVGTAALAAGVEDFGPPSWADSGAAFAPRPVRPEPARAALVAPRPVSRAVPRGPAVVRRPANVVSLAWVNRGGLAVHPRRSVRVDVAALPVLPALPPPPAVAETPAAEPAAARPALVAAKPARRAAPGWPSLARFLRSTAPGTWGGTAAPAVRADAVRRTADRPAPAAAPVVR